MTYNVFGGTLDLAQTTGGMFGETIEGEMSDFHAGLNISTS